MKTAAARRANAIERISLHLRVAARLLDCSAEEAPGPERLECLYCAGRRLLDASVLAERARLPQPVVDKLRARYAQMAADAGEGEVVFDALDGRVLVITRESGKWRERREWAM